MISLDYLRGKKIGVLGIGRTGLATIEALRAGHISFIAWDDKHTQGDFRYPTPKEWEKLDMLVVSPGIPTYYPAPHPDIVKANHLKIPLVSDIDLLYQAEPQAKFIGITGTNGKSTTTALIGHILSECGQNTQIGGNIGNAALSLSPASNVYVLELSSFQLELIRKICFDIAVILNITPDHLDRYASFNDYIDAKSKIINNRNNAHIISVDSPETKQLLNKIRGYAIPISCRTRLKDNGISVIDNIICDRGEELHLSRPNLRGRHNAENIAASYAAAKLMQVEETDICSAISTFKGLDHRMQEILNLQGLRFINDSKATNNSATAQALSTYDNIYWILGGIYKDNSLKELASYFHKINYSFLIGRAADEFAETLNNYGVPHYECGTLKNALHHIKNLNPSNGVILLSPACSSFDQWKNFEDRGRAFCRLVKSIWTTA